MQSVDSKPDLGPLAAKLLNSMVAAGEKIVADMDAEGRVLLEETWTTYSQGCAMILAELYKAEGTPFCGSEEVLAKMAASVRCFLGLLDEKAEVPLVTAMGGWDRMIPSWEYVAFLDLFRFHSDILAPEFKAELTDALARISRAHERALPAERLHNIPCFSASGLWYAGHIFGEEGWKKVAREYLAKIVESQKPDGYWQEHTGPTTNYNLVYINALGQHLADDGEVDVSDALRRAGAFHSRFCYPDGTNVSIIDGRVLYGRGIHALGLPGLLQVESGLGYVRAVAGSSIEIKRPASNGVVFTPQTYRYIRNGLGPVVGGEPEQVPLEGKASVSSAGSFTAALSAFVGVCPLHEDCHWGYERLQHLEVHHRAHGVVIGGGQSQGPEMAFLSSGGVYLADRAHLEESGKRLRLDYSWGEAIVEVSEEGGGFAVNIEVASSGSVRMLLPVLRGWLADESGNMPETGKVKGLERNGLSIRIEPQAELVYPVKPWYTYHPKGEGPEGGWRYGLVWEGSGKLKARLTVSD